MTSGRASVRAWAFVAVAIAVVGTGCGDDDRPGARDAGSGDASAFLDGGGRDAAARPDGATDGGGRDAAADGATPADAGRDSGAMVCRSDADCPRGLACSGGVCVGSGCCLAILCRPGTTCDPETCSCRGGGGGCCDTGTCDDATKYCDFDSCGCVPIPTCEPACEGDFVCDWGSCIPRCYIEGCPDPTHVCTDAGACIPPVCTAEECASMSPPLRCDPSSGCYDACAGGDWSWCTALGGTCHVGECVDLTCGESMGLPRVECGFVVDCCGEWWCQRSTDPAPPCPFVCPEPPPGGFPMPSADLCVCGLGGGIDIDPGGGPPPPPPGGTSIYCADLRWGGGGPVPPPIPVPGSGGGSGGSGGR